MSASRENKLEQRIELAYMDKSRRFGRNAICLMPFLSSRAQPVLEQWVPVLTAKQNLLGDLLKSLSKQNKNPEFLWAFGPD